MATVTTIVERLPYEYQARYKTSTRMLNWINELLEELSGEGLLMPSLKKEAGALIDNSVWITEPPELRQIRRIYHPLDYNQRFTYRQLEGKIKLTDATFPDATANETADAFQNYAVGSFDVNIDDADENEFDKWLLVIDTGTEAGTTIQLSGNDESAAGYCKVYFLHDLASALTDAKILTCSLYSTSNFVMIEHSNSYDAVTGASDEVPIDNKYERRLTDAWLNWKIIKFVIKDDKLSRAAKLEYKDVLRKIKRELRNNIDTSIQPRRMPGLVQYRLGSGEMNKQYAQELDEY